MPSRLTSAYGLGLGVNIVDVCDTTRWQEALSDTRFSMYTGITCGSIGSEQYKREVLRWAIDDVNPVLVKANGDKITKQEAENLYGLVTYVVYKNEVRLNATAMERAIHKATNNPVPEGPTLHRREGAGANGSAFMDGSISRVFTTVSWTARQMVRDGILKVAGT